MSDSEVGMSVTVSLQGVFRPSGIMVFRVRRRITLRPAPPQSKEPSAYSTSDTSGGPDLSGAAPVSADLSGRSSPTESRREGPRRFCRHNHLSAHTLRAGGEEVRCFGPSTRED